MSGGFMNRKTTLFYALLIAVASLAVGMVIASRLDLSPESQAQTLAAPPMNSTPITGPLTATTFRDIAKSVTPAVVNIRTESRQRTQDLTEFFGGDDLFQRFFGSPGQGGQGRRSQPRDQLAVAAGTGFLIDKSGMIITNNHVVEGATKIQVSLYGDEADQTYDAKIIGRDPLTDSALIELTQKPNHTLPEVKFGDSGQVQPGDFVMAIGNPFGLTHTVSVGVISALERSFPVADGRFAQVLQTDAAINPGNSGGPLLNLRGEVVGINTAIYTDARQQGNIGIGFAMPINIVRDLLPQLRTGKITRGRIGVSVGAVPTNALDEFGLKERRGALVATVDRTGPAAAAGMEPGDVIVEFNGKPVKNNNELVNMVVSTKPGTTVPIKVLRDKQEKTFNVKVDELNLEDETARNSRREDGGTDDEEAPSGFGMTLNNITPEIARRLRLDEGVKGAVIVDVDQGSPAARAGLSAGDIITRINRRPVANLAEASRELAKVTSGGTAFLLVIRNGQDQETFVTVTKE
jgi:serine protease Do